MVVAARVAAHFIDVAEIAVPTFVPQCGLTSGCDAKSKSNRQATKMPGCGSVCFSDFCVVRLDVQLNDWRSKGNVLTNCYTSSVMLPSFGHVPFQTFREGNELIAGAEPRLLPALERY
jgi:hypothetical protein